MKKNLKVKKVMYKLFLELCLPFAFMVFSSFFMFWWMTIVKFTV